MIPVGIIHPIFFAVYLLSGIIVLVSIIAFFIFFFSSSKYVWFYSHQRLSLLFIVITLICLIIFVGITYSLVKLEMSLRPRILKEEIQYGGMKMPIGTSVQLNSSSRNSAEWDISGYIHAKFPVSVDYKGFHVSAVERILLYSHPKSSDGKYKTNYLNLTLSADSHFEGFVCSKEGVVRFTTVSLLELQTQDLLFSTCTLEGSHVAKDLDGNDIVFPSKSEYHRYYIPISSAGEPSEKGKFSIEHKINEVNVHAPPVFLR